MAGGDPIACPVEANCRVPSHCPYCVDGSAYDPIDRRVLFPAAAERREARRVARVLHRTTPEYRRGRKSAQKGRRLEQELAHLVGGRRVPLSGALDGMPNDVVARNGWRLEANGRAAQFGTLYRWLGEADVVAFRELEGDGPWLFACRLEWMVARMRSGQEVGEGQDVVRAVEEPTRTPATVTLPGGVRCVVHRTRGGFTTLRRWLTAEGADALCVKADRRGWRAVMDTGHMAALLGSESAERR